MSPILDGRMIPSHWDTREVHEVVLNAFSHQIFSAAVYYVVGPTYPHFADGKTGTCKDEEGNPGLVVSEGLGLGHG